MPLSRANAERELVPGLNALVGLNYKDYEQEWRAIFKEETSKRSFEEEQKLVGFGRSALKPEGETVTYDDKAGETWYARYVMQTYALGFILTEEAKEDNLYDDLGKRYSEQLGRSMRKTKEYNAANILNLGFNTSAAYLGGDGQPLFSANHPTFEGPVNSNFAAVGTDLNEATLENAINQIGTWVDERGLIIAATAEKLIVPIGLQFIAKRILGSPYRPGTADNDINAMKEMGMVAEGCSTNHYLSDPDAWFLITNVPDGLKMFQRVKLSRANDNEFDTGNLKYKVRERYAFGWTDPLGAWGSQGAT